MPPTHSHRIHVTGLAHRFFRACLLALLPVCMMDICNADNIAATPSNYLARLAKLQPGDTLLLGAGRYTHGLVLRNLHGKATQPITIRASEDGGNVEFVGDACCNTVQLDNSSFIRIKNLHLNGSGISGIDAVNARNINHHITIEHLYINGYGGDQLSVGISTKGPAWSWIIRGNTIVEAGTGMYLGNSDGNQPFMNSIIEDNFVLNSIGYDLQIKHQNPRPASITMLVGGGKTIIRHNVFSKVSNYSSGDMARPNVLVGHFPLQGSGKNDVYEIYGNIFYQNPVETLFQGEGNIAFYNNLLINDFGSAIAIQAHNDFPRNIQIFHNTIIASARGIRVSNALHGFTQTVTDNLVFAARKIQAPRMQHNLQYPYSAAARFVNKPSGLLGEIDLYPKANLPLRHVSNNTAYGKLTAAQLDFNGKLRSGQYRGAYTGAGTNPREQYAKNAKSATKKHPAPTALPGIALAASPAAIESGGYTSILWSSQNATHCQAKTADVWSGPKPANNINGEVVGPLHADTVLQLECLGQAGHSRRSISVLVTPPDLIAPGIAAINAGLDGETLLVQFSEPVDRQQAETAANYRFSPALTVVSAKLDKTARLLTLKTSPLRDRTDYKLSVSNIRDMARIPNRIADNTQFDYHYIAPLAITKLTPKNYLIDKLDSGKRLYIDRDYFITDIPHILQNSLFIRTANDDKHNKRADFLQFTVNEDVILYLAYDKRSDTLPAWLTSSGWESLQDEIGSTDDTALQLFRKTLRAGNIVLGGNESGDSMYSVILQRLH